MLLTSHPAAAARLSVLRTPLFLVLIHLALLTVRLLASLETSLPPALLLESPPSVLAPPTTPTSFLILNLSLKVRYLSKYDSIFL